VPQLPGAKQPCIKWKEFQERVPTVEEMTRWFTHWPTAGLALVLGPVSGVFVLDVDGPEAHAALVTRLGGEPVAPKALSGSRKPCRYHLFFHHPELPTKAKATPWHPKLEFRGKGGIVIIPPSLHKSGNRYAWAAGRSPDDLSFPELPPALLAALQPATPRVPGRSRTAATVTVPQGIDASPRTREFLSGVHANGPGWNDKLFTAACDLAGRGLDLEEAELLLLAGAQPWNRSEEELACRTILSAFSQPREPSYR
jgi:hypothetical protein